MSWIEAVINTLKNDSQVSTIVGTKIMPVVLAQGDVFPCILYSQTHERPDYCQGGITNTNNNLQFDLLSKKYSEIELLASHLKRILVPYKSELVTGVEYIDMGADDYLDGAKIFRRTYDYRFFIK